MDETYIVLKDYIITAVGLIIDDVNKPLLAFALQEKKSNGMLLPATMMAYIKQWGRSKAPTGVDIFNIISEFSIKVIINITDIVHILLYHTVQITHDHTNMTNHYCVQFSDEMCVCQASGQ